MYRLTRPSNDKGWRYSFLPPRGSEARKKANLDEFKARYDRRQVVEDIKNHNPKEDAEYMQYLQSKGLLR